VNKEVVGTSIINRAETAAALSEAFRVGTLTRESAASALQVLRSEWPNLVLVQATEMLVSRANALAWDLGLRVRCRSSGVCAAVEGWHVRSGDHRHFRPIVVASGRPTWLASFPRQSAGTVGAWREGIKS
jgi:hypothetical protein